MCSWLLKSFFFLLWTSLVFSSCPTDCTSKCNGFTACGGNSGELNLETVFASFTCIEFDTTDMLMIISTSSEVNFECISISGDTILFDGTATTLNVQYLDITTSNSFQIQNFNVIISDRFLLESTKAVIFDQTQVTTSYLNVFSEEVSVTTSFIISNAYYINGVSIDLNESTINCGGTKDDCLIEIIKNDSLLLPVFQLEGSTFTTGIISSVDIAKKSATISSSTLLGDIDFNITNSSSCNSNDPSIFFDGSTGLPITFGDNANVNFYLYGDNINYSPSVGSLCSSVEVNAAIIISNADVSFIIESGGDYGFNVFQSPVLHIGNNSKLNVTSTLLNAKNNTVDSIRIEDSTINGGTNSKLILNGILDNPDSHEFENLKAILIQSCDITNISSIELTGTDNSCINGSRGVNIYQSNITANTMSVIGTSNVCTLDGRGVQIEESELSIFEGEFYIDGSGSLGTLLQNCIFSGEQINIVGSASATSGVVLLSMTFKDFILVDITGGVAEFGFLPEDIPGVSIVSGGVFLDPKDNSNSNFRINENSVEPPFVGFACAGQDIITGFKLLGGMCDILINGDILANSLNSGTCDLVFNTTNSALLESGRHYSIDILGGMYAESGNVRFDGMTSLSLHNNVTLLENGQLEFSNVDTLHICSHLFAGGISIDRNDETILLCPVILEADEVLVKNIQSSISNVGLTVIGSFTVAGNIGTSTPLTYLTVQGDSTFEIDMSIETLELIKFEGNINVLTNHVQFTSFGIIQFEGNVIDGNGMVSTYGDVFLDVSCDFEVPVWNMYDGEVAIQGEASNGSVLFAKSEITIVGRGQILNELEITEPFTYIIPDAPINENVPLRINNLIATHSPYFRFEVDGNQSSFVKVETFTMNPGTFVYINMVAINPIQGQDYTLITGIDNSIPKTIFKTVSGTNINNCTSEDDFWYMYFEDGEAYSLKTHLNSPPQVSNDVCKVDCAAGSKCTCCVDVLLNDSDPDSPCDTLSFAIIDDDLTVNGNQTCFSTNILTSNLTFERSYVAYDEQNALSSEGVIEYIFNLLSTSTPTPSITSSVTPSISITAKESLVMAPPPDNQVPTSPNQVPSSQSIPSVSIQVTPTSAQDCTSTNCISGGVSSNLSPDNTINGNTAIPLTNGNGEEIGVVTVPIEIAPGGTITVDFSSGSFSANNVDIGQAIFDISILNEFGISVTEFNDKIEICFVQDSSDITNDSCLGFFDTEKQEWVCEDACLDEQGNDNFCGKTDHLTSFALLLDGANNGGGCDSDFDYILTWISLGLVGFCVVMCCIAVGINELKYQQLAYRKRNTLAEITEIRS